MKKVLFIFVVFLLISCENQKDAKIEESEAATVSTKSVAPEYTVVTTQDPEFGWGYQLFKDGKLIIDQKHIPAIQGKKGFSSKEDADKTANYILDKIKKGAFPPTISIEELDSLGVLN